MWDRVVFCCLFFMLVCADISDDDDQGNVFIHIDI